GADRDNGRLPGCGVARIIGRDKERCSLLRIEAANEPAPMESVLRGGAYARSIQLFTISTLDFWPRGWTFNSLAICRTVRPSAWSWRARSTRRLYRYCLQVGEQVSRLARLIPGARRKNL